MFEGQTALISGGASGLGLGIALAFAKAGMRVALGYRNEAARAQAEEVMAEAGCHCGLFVKLDVTDRAAWAAAADAVEQAFGKIHVLVNNAGVSVFGQIDEARFADWDWVLGVNLGGVVNGLVTLLPRIKQHGEGGYVVNVGSMAGFLPGPQAGLYTASKFAVRGLTESLRYTLAPTNIGVSLMSPGLVTTQAFRAALKRPPEFADSGLGPVDAALLDQLEPIFATGMPPEEAGRRLLDGMRARRFHIFTHPEFATDFREIADELVAALPKEEVPPARLAAEDMRRRVNRLALQRRIDRSDLMNSDE
jgi:NAD(P)-dependent dehydrogenase (short-subunit alcohol dehydrogenase family)